MVEIIFQSVANKKINDSGWLVEHFNAYLFLNVVAINHVSIGAFTIYDV